MPVPRFQIEMTPAEMLRCLASLFLSHESEVERFEGEIASFVGRRFAVSFPSGRLALYALLLSLNTEEDRREILIPAFTVPEVVTMVRAAGWKPVFADAHTSRYNVEAIEAERRLDKKTSALLMTHLFGQVSDIDGLAELAQRKKLILLEDAAQALGASYCGKRAGSFGTASLLSFGLVKNLTTLGGGMVLCDDGNLDAALRKLRASWSSPGRFSLLSKLALSAAVKIATSKSVFSLATFPVLEALDIAGSDLADRIFDEDPAELAMKKIPARMLLRYSPQQASWGLLQLEKFEMRNEKRRANALFLRELLEGVEGLALPEFDDKCCGIHLNFAVRHENPALFIKRLRRKGLDTSMGYLGNCAANPLFAEFASDCPVAASLERELFYLPVYPSLSRSDMLAVAETVRKTCNALL